MLLERLELYISAGLTVDRALAICAENLNKKQEQSLLRVREKVCFGGTLSSGLDGEIGFSQTICGLMRHGESSGSLLKSLASARQLLERQEELLKKSLSAMIYPAVIGLFACCLVIGLTRGVMPQIIPMLRSLNVKLPFLTVVVMNFSQWLVDYGLGLLIFATVVTIAAPILYRRWTVFRYGLQVTIMRCPIIGSLFHNYFLIVFLRSLGALVDSGVNLQKAYAGSVGTLGLLPLRARLAEMDEAIGRGLPLGKALSSRTISPFVGSLILAGESSGNLAPSILRTASILDREMEYSLKQITSLIEPVLMILLGLIVGGIALSIMMPIYDISKVLQV